MKSVSIWITVLMAMFTLFWSFPAMADSESCPRIITHYENLQVSRETMGSKDEICYVSLHPMNVKNMKYRDFLVTSEGLLMVFNSFGEGNSSTTTGAREFYFFPRSIKDLEVIPETDSKRVAVTFANQLQVKFSTVSADIIELGKATVNVNPDVEPQHKGGVEIKQHQGLLLDVGFTMGHSPSENKDGSSTFVDEKGTSCQVKNREIFKYVDGNASIAFNDQDLKNFLKKRCPKLSVSF